MTIIRGHPAQERIAIAPREDRIAELELLQEYLLDAVQEVDARTESVLAPVERMRKLLTAKDKRETLLQMAGDPFFENFLGDGFPIRPLNCSCQWARNEQNSDERCMAHVEVNCVIFLSLTQCVPLPLCLAIAWK